MPTYFKVMKKNRKIAISVNDISKEYHIYQKPIYRVFDALLPFKNKQYRSSFTALSDINFEVEDGESVGIIGRNGSGKSTLLQMICRNLQPSTGNIAVNGRISALLELGAGFNPEFTGRENVYLNTAILGLSKAETDERFEQIADFAEIGDFIDRPVKTYSSGMYVRLAFSTAISVEPEILIIDEALAVGDIFFQQKCVAHMRKMMQGCTILLVSHDMHSITNMCDRVIVLNEGKMVYEGDPAEGVSKYTKLIHSNQKKHVKRIANDELLSPAVQKASLELHPDFDSWEPVENSDLGGVGEIKIERVSVTNNGMKLKTVEKGDRLKIRMLINSSSDKDQIIFGYTVKDRVGNAIFGENSLCLDKKPLTVSKGYNIVCYEFDWPEIYPASYTLTLGVGEGEHPLSHVVQCWAHNIVSFAAVTSGVAVHGMFNNPLNDVDVTSLPNESHP